ncbi:MAG: hypothetical protein AB1489_28830, partial [Acidobacteriota bacterium]
HPLLLSADLAKINTDSLKLLLMKFNNDEIVSKREIEDLFQKLGVKINLCKLENQSIKVLIKKIQEEESGILILPKQNKFFETISLQILLREIDCPIMLV